MTRVTSSKGFWLSRSDGCKASNQNIRGIHIDFQDINSILRRTLTLLVPHTASCGPPQTAPHACVDRDLYTVRLFRISKASRSILGSISDRVGLYDPLQFDAAPTDTDRLFIGSPDLALISDFSEHNGHMLLNLSIGTY